MNIGQLLQLAKAEKRYEASKLLLIIWLDDVSNTKLLHEIENDFELNDSGALTYRESGREYKCLYRAGAEYVVKGIISNLGGFVTLKEIFTELHARSYKYSAMMIREILSEGNDLPNLATSNNDALATSSHVQMMPFRGTTIVSRYLVLSEKCYREMFRYGIFYSDLKEVLVSALIKTSRTSCTGAVKVHLDHDGLLVFGETSGNNTTFTITECYYEDKSRYVLGRIPESQEDMEVFYKSRSEFAEHYEDLVKGWEDNGDALIF